MEINGFIAIAFFISFLAFAALIIAKLKNTGRMLKRILKTIAVTALLAMIILLCIQILGSYPI